MAHDLGNVEPQRHQQDHSHVVEGWPFSERWIGQVWSPEHGALLVEAARGLI